MPKGDKAKLNKEIGTKVTKGQICSGPILITDCNKIVYFCAKFGTCITKCKIVTHFILRDLSIMLFELPIIFSRNSFLNHLQYCSKIIHGKHDHKIKKSDFCTGSILRLTTLLEKVTVLLE